MSNWYNEKFRFIIEEARTNRIVSYDLPVMNPKIMRKLSGPSVIEFDVDYRDDKVVDDQTGLPIRFKPWGHWCHVEHHDAYGNRKIFASGLMKPSEVDPKTGLLRAQFEGFSNYPKEIPWLQNWNPIAVDPFTVVNRIWSHIQSYSNGNLGVVPYSLGPNNSKVIPPVSNTLMLPGFSFDGQTLVINFFSIFIRAVDFTDCGEYITKLARDIPFDYFEEAEWNSSFTGINKYLRLGYQDGGATQDNLVFRLNENVFEAKSKIESEIEWTSDIIIRGWFPGKVYSSQLSNADPTRYRRVILEEDANINSNERAAAWSHRQLTRRQIPNYWESIIVNMYHPNAPFGSYDVGDTIRVQGVMPWVGEVDQAHKIIAISIDPATNTCELILRAKDAFDYDPIFFQGIENNLVSNASFTNSLSGWTQAKGSWSRDPFFGNTNVGSAKVVANGQAKELITSDYIDVVTNDRVAFSASVYWEGAESFANSAPIRISAKAYNSSNVVVSEPVFNAMVVPDGNAGQWLSISGKWMVPAGVTKIKARLEVTGSMRSGDVWFDDVFVSKYTLPSF